MTGRDRKPGHLDEAHEPAEHDMHRQPLIDRRKPLKDKYTWPELVVTFVWIILILSVLVFALKKGGVL
jgi:hypothetical protein